MLFSMVAYGTKWCSDLSTVNEDSPMNSNRFNPRGDHGGTEHTNYRHVGRPGVVPEAGSAVERRSVDPGEGST